MQHRIIIGAVAAIAGVGLWYAFRPERLFIDQTVNEEFPVAAATAATPTAAEMASMGAMGPVSESMPGGAGSVLAVGRFHGVAHETRGTATVHELGDGRRLLRLTDFRTSNGPDVRVYLVAAPDASDDETVTRAGFVEIAPLKGNEGDQNYELPADLDLAKYRAVTIWCKRFGVNFATAPLRAAATPASLPVPASTPAPLFRLASLATDDAPAADAAPVALLAGRFHGNAHDTKGTATIYRLDDGSRLLRLTDFSTSNGPDVRVYLVAASDVADDATVGKAGFVELGALKGNKGDQNYVVPASVDLARYRTVTIWCKRFSVNFGSAPLKERAS